MNVKVGIAARQYGKKINEYRRGLREKLREGIIDEDMYYSNVGKLSEWYRYYITIISGTGDE